VDITLRMVGIIDKSLVDALRTGVIGTVVILRILREDMVMNKRKEGEEEGEGNNGVEEAGDVNMKVVILVVIVVEGTIEAEAAEEGASEEDSNKMVEESIEVVEEGIEVGTLKIKVMGTEEGVEEEEEVGEAEVEGEVVLAVIPTQMMDLLLQRMDLVIVHHLLTILTLEPHKKKVKKVNNLKKKKKLMR